MRILFILEYFHPHIGGVETLFKQLTEELAKEGHEITVLTNLFDPELATRAHRDDITIHRYPFKNRYLFTFLGWFPALRLARKADIIHTTSYNAAFPAWIAKTLLRKKCIITFHEYWGKLWFDLPFLSKPSARLYYVLEWCIVRLKFDHYVAVSEYTRRALLEAGIKESRLTRIYNGIQELDPVIQRDIHPGSIFGFLFFGRLSYSKGIDLLIKAAGILKRNGRKFKLTIITSPGPASILKKVTQHIDQEDLSRNIDLMFELPDDKLKQAIASCDAVVIPSYSEGFCFAAVETIQIGVPIVSSGRGALREVVSGTFTTAPTFDSAGLARAMEDAMDGNWTTTPVVPFRLDDTVQAYLDLYESMSRQSN